MQKYQTTIEKIGTTTLAAPLPEEIASRLREDGHKRFIVQLMDHKLHCAIHFRKDVGHFFYFGKTIWKKLGLSAGDEVMISVMPDTSTYQAEMPEEFEAVLESDAEAREAFESLTPGRKRSLMILVGRLKRESSRIDKSLKICEKLKMGITDLRELQQ